MMSQTIDPDDFPELPPLPTFSSDEEFAERIVRPPIAPHDVTGVGFAPQVDLREPAIEPPAKPKRKKFGGAKRPEAETTGEIVSTSKRREVYVRPDPVKIKKSKLRIKKDKDGKPLLADPLEEEYDQQRVRKEARRRTAMAFQALDDILSPNGRLHKEATAAQVLKAAEMVLERAVDRPATATPDDNDKDKHVLILDKSLLPTPD